LIRPGGESLSPDFQEWDMPAPMMDIPAEDLTRQYSQIQEEIHAAIDQVLPSGKYTMGPILESFENQMAAFCGVKHCIGISNGTEALHLALVAMGVGPGDEVITQANTYVATAFAVSYLGARPVFVDIQPDSYNIDIGRIEAAISDRTRVIIPVHMYGNPTDMDPLMQLARRRGLKVLEDASHAAGAIYKGRKTCSLGDAAAISFYPSKVLGAYGDAGAVLTNDDELAEQVRLLRYMGQKVKHTHLVIGYQQRLDPMQAAILSVKLRHLEDWIERRRAIATRYNQLLSGLPVVTPSESPNSRHVYYMYTILSPKRDQLVEHLESQGIGTQKIYATPVPMQPCYQFLEYSDSDIPVAADCARRLLCLPIFPELTDSEIERTAASVADFFSKDGST
jgi:dTDP-4-amino-4,6-dideoxygalactose transaminase